MFEGDLAINDESAMLASGDVECIDGNLFVAEASLSELALPHLSLVTGDLRVDACDNLVSISLPSLSRVSGELEITKNYDLASLDLGGLVTTGVLTIWINQNLATIELPVLESAESLYVRGSDQSRSIGAPRLANVSGKFGISGVDAPADLDFPTLSGVGGEFFVTQCPGLAHLSGFGALSRVELDFSIVDDDSLATCEAEALASQVESRDGVGGAVDIHGNDDGGSCD